MCLPAGRQDCGGGNRTGIEKVIKVIWTRSRDYREFI